MTRTDPAILLVRRVANGDADALEALYDVHTPLLYSVAMRIVRSEADAEDVVQQSWVGAWTGARGFDPSRGTVVVWLLAIVRGVALDLCRARASRRRAEAAAPPPARIPADPGTGAADTQIHQRVKLALQRLDPQQRQVLESAYFEGLTQSEIAERLETPLGTVKTWARRGLLRLRDLLPQEGGT
jgi:RNA polymerase sigma-70 factor (ECF subfamily)